MATVIWMGLAAVWAWHLIDLFGEVAPRELSPRARQRLSEDANEPTHDWPRAAAHARATWR